MESVAVIIVGTLVVLLILHAIEGVGNPGNGALAWLKSKMFLNVTYTS